MVRQMLTTALTFMADGEMKSSLHPWSLDGAVLVSFMGKRR
jgi:hypothetical protein